MSEILVCIQCGFTHAEFLARGLLGCPECYTHFGEALFDDLLHVHPALHRRPPAPKEVGPVPEDSGVLREKLSNALRYERYEEAAELRRRLRELSDLAAAAGDAA
jgi:protein arginine kinase activator